MKEAPLIEVKGAAFEPSPVRKTLSYLFTIIQVSMYILILQLHKFKNTMLLFMSEKNIDWILSYRIIIGLFVFLIGNILSPFVKQSNAFECYLDKKLVWSSLKQGKVPTYEEIKEFIINKKNN